MSKTTMEKIESVQEQIRQLENHKKRLLQAQKEQERKTRTRRLCKRAGLFESLLPETVSLTDAQFEIFLKKTVANDYGKRVLAALAEQGGSAPTEKQAAEQWRSTDRGQRRGAGGGFLAPAPVRMAHLYTLKGAVLPSRPKSRLRRLASKRACGRSAGGFCALRRKKRGWRRG